MKLFNIVTASIALLLCADIGHAVQPSPSAESFANEIVRAIRSKKTDQRIAVLHPKSRACINSTTRPFFDWIFTRQFRYQLPTRFKVSSTPLTGPIGPLPDHSAYPVPPTHQLQIDFQITPTSSTTIVVMAHYDGKRWSEVLPCPTPETIAGARKSSAEADRQNRRINELAANVAAPLRSELLALLRAGRRVDAIRRYASATGEELVIAKGVVELLQESIRQENQP